MNRFRITVLVLLAAASTAALAQPIDPNLYSGLQWRLIGPFRGGKATMVSGSARQSRAVSTWARLAAAVEDVDGRCGRASLTGIGAVALAPSRPDTVYVAGRRRARRQYTSTDAGEHWNLVALKGTEWLPSRSTRKTRIW